MQSSVAFIMQFFFCISITILLTSLTPITPLLMRECVNQLIGAFESHLWRPAIYITR